MKCKASAMRCKYAPHALQDENILYGDRLYYILGLGFRYSVLSVLTKWLY
mgnify:CR=1 FL=1